ncbi:hypothetical protein EI74_0280 [Mycoplasma testudineum]|uniref:Uncharacterized protein n=1 Tax=Mycoplasma testudineum TaxID=244584 RepID=A0A4R6IDV5_9MOLU|nr:hypothetical protein [Mycoplasma testudineum]OYD26905.1 hypothetical protein CG473_01015 [Mycoplasma testudineum]TDO20453.1 hypothetical protein EI74_0280 [Mycoplasma testudineum]
MFKRKLIFVGSALSIFAAAILSISAPLSVVSAKFSFTKNNDAEIARQKTVKFFSKKESISEKNNSKTLFVSDKEEKYRQERILLEESGKNIEEKIFFLENYLIMMEYFSNINVDFFKQEMGVFNIDEENFSKLKREFSEYVNFNPNIKYAQDMLSILKNNKVELNKSYSSALYESKRNLEKINYSLGIISTILFVAARIAQASVFFAWLGVFLEIIAWTLVGLVTILNSVQIFSPHFNNEKNKTIDKLIDARSKLDSWMWLSWLVPQIRNARSQINENIYVLRNTYA